MVSQLCALAQHGAFAVSAIGPRARRADLCLPRRHVHHEHVRVCCPDSQLASEGLVGRRPTMPMRLEMRQDASHLCVASGSCGTTVRPHSVCVEREPAVLFIYLEVTVFIAWVSPLVASPPLALLCLLVWPSPRPPRSMLKLPGLWGAVGAHCRFPQFTPVCEGDFRVATHVSRT